MQPSKLVELYMKMSNVLDTKMQKLSKDLEPINKLLQQRAKLERKLEGLEAQISEGLDRMEGLKGSYFDAHFMENWDEQNQIQERRNHIQLEVEALKQEKSAAETELEELVIPSEAIGELAAQVDVLSVPEYLRFLWELKVAIQDKNMEQRNALDKLQRSLPREQMSEDSYHDKRAELDDSWEAARAKVGV